MALGKSGNSRHVARLLLFPVYRNGTQELYRTFNPFIRSE